MREKFVKEGSFIRPVPSFYDPMFLLLFSEEIDPTKPVNSKKLLSNLNDRNIHYHSPANGFLLMFAFAVQ
jgi:hypothetical protein